MYVFFTTEIFHKFKNIEFNIVQTVQENVMLF